MASSQAGTTETWQPRAADLAIVALVAGVLGRSFAPSISELIDQWNRDPNHSYGFLVVPIALVIFWDRRGLLDKAKLEPSWWGLLPLLGLLGLRILLFEWNERYVETAMLPLVVAAVVLALGGWHLVRVAWPSIVFLFFMLPLPPSLNFFLASPLQRVATIGSVMTLQLMGLPVLAEGNVIVVGAEQLEVARACNGLSMLLTFITLITATVILIRRPLWERALLLASAIPIALVSNIIRITATAWCYHEFGHEAGEKIAHDWAGYAMMPIALGLVFLEVRLISWLVVEVEPAAPRSSVRAGTETGGG